jgi:sarcosine oxidase subunit alpha
MSSPRLPPPVAFRRDGRYAAALPGETLLQALSRLGPPLLSRSVRYHRPRGPLCGRGQCTGCLVRLNGVPNVRACEVFPQTGDEIRGENAWPSVGLDLLAILDLWFRHGVDTLHGFRRPAWLRPVYQGVVRRLAGHGRLPSKADVPTIFPSRPPERVNLLVIGAGPAGQALISRWAPEGESKVLWVDRRAGPDPWRGWLSDVDRTGVEWQTSVIHLVRREAGLFEALVSSPDQGARLIRADRVVLATGAYDGYLLFGNNDRPGVLTADGLEALFPPDGPPPVRRALVFGGGVRALEVVRHLPGRVVAVASPEEIEPELAREASQERALLLPRHLLLRAGGSRRVRRAILVDRHRTAVRKLSVEAIILAHRRLPNIPLLFQAGARMRFVPGPCAYFPELDEGFQTSVPGLYAIGEVAGCQTPTEIVASARATATALQGPQVSPRESRTGGPVAHPREDGPGPWLTYYRDFLAYPARGKRFACYCEDVLLEEVDAAVHEGFGGLEVIKRMTGVGTGLCQGRYCLPEVLLLLSLFEGKAPPEVGFTTQRPPVWPTLLGQLAPVPLGEEGNGELRGTGGEG